jgi:hypothetical protein
MLKHVTVEVRYYKIVRFLRYLLSTAIAFQMQFHIQTTCKIYSHWTNTTEIKYCLCKQKKRKKESPRTEDVFSYLTHGFIA